MHVRAGRQSALFNFRSLLTVILLFICTCAYLRPKVGFLDRNKTGLTGVFWKAARYAAGLAPSLCVPSVTRI